MKKLFAIFLLVQLLCTNLASAASLSEAQENIWKSYTAGTEAEKARDFDTALFQYNKFLDYAQTLEREAGQNHRENIRSFVALKNHLEGSPELYVEAKNPADSVYFGAKHEPKFGTYVGKCDEFYSGTESAYLLYVTFGDRVSDYAYLLPKGKNLFLEIAWNLPQETKESLDRVAGGDYDAYIIENLKYINQLDHKVMLRFGAEVNCWNLPTEEAALAEFIAVFKTAFRKVATLTRQYAPNAALVYSPNDVSNWNASAEDFYPGDEYVDWVGLSMYDNAGGSNEPVNMTDAYYCTGLYANPIAKIKNIVDAFGDRKPIMISECGFSYAGGLENRSISHMNKFYHYVNMVYPQVKAVFYFNADVDGSFSLGGSSRVKNNYLRLLSENVGMAASLSGEQKGYTRFSTINERTDKLNIYAYAEFPTGVDSDVRYYLDDAPVRHSGGVPYGASIDVKSLSQGQHTLTMAVSNSGYECKKDYVFYVRANNFVTTSPDSYDTSAPDEIDIPENTEDSDKSENNEESQKSGFFSKPLVRVILGILIFFVIIKIIQFFRNIFVAY